jgi:hypothetical protein
MDTILELKKRLLVAREQNDLQTMENLSLELRIARQKQSKKRGSAKEAYSLLANSP